MPARVSPEVAASALIVGKKVMGRDGKWWEAKKQKDGRFRWARASVSAATKSLEGRWPGQSTSLGNFRVWLKDLGAAEKKVLEDLRGPVKKELENLGVFVLLIPSRRSKDTGLYWFDWMTSVINNFQESNFAGVPYLDGKALPFVAVELGLGVEGTPAKDERIDSSEVPIMHFMPRGQAEKVRRVLRARFKKKYEWSGDMGDKMFVRLRPRIN